MNGEFVLGIDLGTSYFKIGLFDRAGALCGLARLPVPKGTGDPDCYELEPSVFWHILHQGIQSACAEASSTPASIGAVSYSSQANSFLLLDEAGDPLTPLILWRDLRAKATDRRIEELWQHPDYLSVTGMDIRSPELMIAKLAWLRTHARSYWDRARRILTLSDYLVFGLTGQPAGDEGTASLLGLWDLQHHTWWHTALEQVHVPAHMLSRPLPVGAPIAALSPAGARLTGLPEGIPLAAGSLDHHMAAIGAGLGAVAEAIDSTGTVLALLRMLDAFLPRPGCCMGPGACARGYYQMTFSDNGAAGLEWYQREHAPGCSLDDLLNLAAEAPPGAGGLVALPSAGTFRKLEGFLIVTDSHTHGHFVRALLESCAADVAHLTEVLFGDDRPARIAATGGGARSDLWLQIKADMLGTEFVVTACSEPACLGAAMLAARVAGWFRDAEDVSNSWIGTIRRFTPDATRQRFYADWRARYAAMVPA